VSFGEAKVTRRHKKNAPGFPGAFRLEVHVSPLPRARHYFFFLAGAFFADFFALAFFVAFFIDRFSLT
jgi:hypothetical protein